MFMRKPQKPNKLHPGGNRIAMALMLALSFSNLAICQPVVNIPVTLEKGTIRSPEFTVKNKQYIIKLQADKTLPDGQLKCMLGIHHASQPDHCEMMGFHLAVEAEWTLYADGQPVAHGTVQGKDENGEFTNHNISRWIASFTGEKGKKYVLEFTFTKDGTALRVANPRLVVELNPGSYM
jgi:hypothetical protein